jgi:hypothetical protein
MKTLLPFLLFFCLLITQVFAQLGKHAASPMGGAAGAASPGGAAAGPPGATSASSGTAEPGFVYYLKDKWHLLYASTRIETYYFTKRALIDSPALNDIFKCKIDPSKLITATFILDRKVNRDKWLGAPSFQEYDLRPWANHCNCGAAIASPVCPTLNDTFLIVTLIYNDSIPRYWNVSRKIMFDKSRLRLAIIQDSAILKANIYYDNFVNKITPNPALITNPNKIFLGKIPAYVKETQKEKALTAKTYLELLAEYNLSVAAYKTAIFKKLMSNNKDLANALGDDEVVKKYRDIQSKNAIALAKYDQVVSRSKQGLDDLRNKIDDPDLIKDTTRNRIAFLQGLYALNTDANLQPPPPPPTDLIDKSITEVAIPIDGNDSAQDFYFKIYHKSRSNQPFYFTSFHYSAWDYGTLTVPFRYRFSRSNAHILTQPGKDSIATVPEESDAQLNLSGYFGRKWGTTKFYEDPSKTVNIASFEATLFAGPTLIPLTISNIDTTSKYVGLKNNYTYTGPANMIAMSIGAGFVLQWKTVNLGIFLGWDIPITGQTGWVYADKPWMGFGIGINLGSLSSSIGLQ